MTNRNMVKMPKSGTAPGPDQSLPEPNVDGPTITHPTEDDQDVTAEAPEATLRPDPGGDGLKKPSRRS